MKCEINPYCKKKKTNEDEDNNEDQLHDGYEDFSDASRDNLSETNFLQDLGTQGLNHNHSGDDLDDLILSGTKQRILIAKHWMHDISY